MADVKDQTDLDKHLRPGETRPGDPDHAAFVEAKIRKGLAEAEKREDMIPAEDVWEKLGLER